MIPRYAALLHVITGLPHGVGFLVELRADVLAVRGDDPAVGLLRDELTGHLSTLFDVGLLELRQITWDSPASVLDRLMATEAVHAISGWNDLRHRLDGDQRCYGFFHPALVNEPIVFVEIALTHGLADNLPELLNREDAVDGADTAIFYSITSCQPGLAGVHLGNELIKQVVDELRPTTTTSGRSRRSRRLPGFRTWVVAQHRGRRAHSRRNRDPRSRCGRHPALVRPHGRRTRPRRVCSHSPCALPHDDTRRSGARPGGQLPPVQRCVPRADQLDGQPGAVRGRRSRSA